MDTDRVGDANFNAQQADAQVAFAQLLRLTTASNASHHPCLSAGFWLGAVLCKFSVRDAVRCVWWLLQHQAGLC